MDLLRREFGGGVNGESHLIPAGGPSTSVKESYHGWEGLCSFLRLSMPWEQTGGSEQVATWTGHELLLIHSLLALVHKTHTHTHMYKRTYTHTCTYTHTKGNWSWSDVRHNIPAITFVHVYIVIFVPFCGQLASSWLSSLWHKLLPQEYVRGHGKRDLRAQFHI